MRKIIESTLVSLDGVIGDPHIWAVDYFDKEAEEHALELLLECDAMLMGRGTYEFFAATFPHRTGVYGDRVNNIPKYVFSSSLKDATWANSSIVRGDVGAEVTKLKQQGRKDLVTYGHGQLGQALLEHALLDELKLWIHPIFVGSGRLVFREGQKTVLKLLSTKTLKTGTLVASYRPERMAHA
jgi:dihydrofolate reductase